MKNPSKRLAAIQKLAFDIIPMILKTQNSGKGQGLEKQ